MTEITNNKQEQGRSMVEMLGVLAVVGVLSVGGITGYTYAMNKHYANELLMGASERAVLVTAQLASGREPNLNEFAHYSNVGGTFGQAEELEDGSGFIIPVSGVKGAVCENLIKAIDGTEITIAKDDGETLTYITEEDCDDGNDNNLVFVFETGLAGSGSGTGTSECPPPCPSGQQCIGGTCAEVTGECSNNADCDDWCETNGGGEKCYCAINADYLENDSACYNNFTGQCAVATPKTGIKGGYTVSKYTTSWWSAVNFCEAHDKSLVSLADLGITGGYQDGDCQGSECTGGDWEDLRGKLGSSFYWTTDAVSCEFGECTSGTNNNSCNTFIVSTGLSGILYRIRYAASYALCQ